MAATQLYQERRHQTANLKADSQALRTVNYSEYRGITPPDQRVGKLGDIYIDENAKQAYGYVTSGWKRFQGIGPQVEPVVHPLDSTHILYPGRYLTRMAWMSQKLPNDKLSPDIHDNPVEIVSLILGNSPPKQDKRVRVREEGSSTDNNQSKRQRVVTVENNSRDLPSLDKRSSNGLILRITRPNAQTPGSSSGSNLNSSDSKNGVIQAIQKTARSLEVIDLVSDSEEDCEMSKIKAWLSKYSLSEHYEILVKKKLGTQAELARFKGWDENKLRGMLSETIPSMEAPDIYCLANALHEWDW